MADFDHIFVGGGLKTDGCCERCVFGTGEHADWCDAPRLAGIKRETARLAEIDLGMRLVKLTPRGLRCFESTGAPDPASYLKV
jgi:hypothetical protein